MPNQHPVPYRKFGISRGRALARPANFVRATKPARTDAVPVFALAIMGNFDNCGQ